MNANSKKYGKVKFFAEGKGYGFIIPDDGSKEVFFHIKNVVNGKIHLPQKDDHVTYVTTKGRRGDEAGEVTIVA